MTTRLLRNLLVLALVVVLSGALKAQEKYFTKGMEFIFSFADYQENSGSINTPPRFTMFFHSFTNAHKDFSPFHGIYTGIGIRNVGFIVKQNDTLIKRRNYYVGIPLALKFGNLKRDRYVFIGAEAELALNYKEKRFVSDDRVSKFNEWFSNRTPMFMPSLFAGINFENGYSIKFKYYLNDFLDKNYESNSIKPYKDISSSNVFYFSVAANIRDGKVYKHRIENKRSTFYSSNYKF